MSAMTELSILIPKNTSLDGFNSCALLPSFSPVTLAFLEELSKALLTTGQSTQLPELTALGFWLRKSNIKRMQQSLSGIHKPLGTVVHFTPANVDTMFVYSWVCSLIMGNRNIVRVATQASDLRTQLELVLNQLFEDSRFVELSKANLFVSYDKNSHWTEQLSKQANARVIWGGDTSVTSIRAFPTPARCRDISFADRYSVVLINGNKLSTKDDIESVAERLWRDSQAYSQQACSSPKVLFWFGSTRNQPKFFETLNRLAKPTQQIQQTNQHFVTSQLVKQAVATEVVYLEAICVLELSTITPPVYEKHTGNGLFYLQQIDKLDELIHIIDDKCQTLTYWGFEQAEILKLIYDPSITGIDRAVPIGHALDFEYEWDGYNLLSQLSRSIQVE